MSGNALTELLSAPPAGAGHGRGARLREVFDQRDGLLLAIGAELLREAKDQPGTRQMMAQLMGRGLLGLVYETLAANDPGAAGQLVHVASRMDGSVERILKRPQVRAGVELSDEEAGLLADWLRVLAGAAGRVLEQRNARCRARMALAWGKIAQIERMGEQWLEDPDARVRANAVESLWGRADAEAVEIFRRKLEDAHQRVAANAAVGLYLAGESEAVKALWRMATEGDAARKAAAVWAMGRTGDARFLPVLARMRQMQPAPVLVMRNLAAAKERILHVEEAPREPLSVEAAAVAGRGDLQVDVRVSREDGTPVQELRPVDFCVEVNGEVAWDYRVRRRPPPEGAAVWLVAPGDSHADVELLAKRIETEAGPWGGRIEGAAGYSARGSAYGRNVGDVLGLGAAGVEGAGDLARSLEGWQEMMWSCVRRLSARAGEKHVVVVTEREPPGWMEEGLEHAAAICKAAGARLDVLREPGAPAGRAEEAARASGGAVQTVRRGNCGEALRRLAERWQDGWRLEAAGADVQGLQKLRVTVRTGLYSGEAELERAGA